MAMKFVVAVDGDNVDARTSDDGGDPGEVARAIAMAVVGARAACDQLALACRADGLAMDADLLWIEVLGKAGRHYEVAIQSGEVHARSVRVGTKNDAGG
jgi:hypothetical protein